MDLPANGPSPKEGPAFISISWFRKVRGFWQGLSSGKRRLASSLFVVLAVHLLLEIMSSAGWRRQAENAAIDWMISASTHPIFSSQSADARVAFTFLDVDDGTYMEWKDPFFTPRDKLLELIKFAIQNKARIVIVDVDLTNKTGPLNDKALDGRNASADDINLARLLENPYAEASGSKPPIVLVRGFKRLTAWNPRACREPIPSFLEQSDFHLSSSVYFASVKYEEEEDQVIRRWRLWERVCGSNTPEFVPSVQLLTAMLLYSGYPEDKEVQSRFRDFAATIPVESKHSCEWPGEAVRKWQAGKGIELTSARSDVSERIVYRVRWQEGGGGQGWPLVHLSDDGKVPVLMRISARAVTDPNADHPSPPQDFVENRVVVIGGSALDARDWYGSPLGVMPGALILINSIDSLSQNGQLNLPSCLIYYLILFSVTAAMVWVFSYFHQFWAMLVSGAGIILILLPISYFYLRHGRWLDFAIPLIAVQLHNMAEEFKEAAGHIRSEGAKG
jgi:CHASE2 domain-containing sensor protein